MIVVIFLIAALITQSVLHYFDRRDMLNRFSSSNHTPKKDNDTPPQHIPSAHEQTLKRWRNAKPKKAGDS
jgi:hypothetical protein